VAKQRAAFDNAMESGLKNEQAGTPNRRWPDSGISARCSSTPTATSAHDKDVALLNRVTPDATRLLNRAASDAKTDDLAQASKLYQQVLEMLLPGDEIREKAAKQLEALKR
jgi:hypothetical protein